MPTYRFKEAQEKVIQHFLRELEKATPEERYKIVRMLVGLLDERIMVGIFLEVFIFHKDNPEETERQSE